MPPENNQVEEIKRKIDIVELIGEYVELKKSGRNYKGLCPFHAEKTPSFMVSQELQIFKCFGCGVGGDVFRFLMDVEKIEFPQALKILADRAGVKLQPIRGFAGYEEKEELYKVNVLVAEFYHYLLVNHQLGEPARQYLARRGIMSTTIDEFNIGFAPDRPDTLSQFLTRKRSYKGKLLEKAGISVERNGKYFDRFRGRIMFPLFDHFGNISGFSGRVIKDGGDIAKYINSPDTLVYKKGNTLFGLNVTKQKIKASGFAVVVEGEFDLLSSYQAGVKNVVAIKGSAFTPDQAELISRFCSQVYLALDADFAGDQAARRGIEVLKKAGVGIRIVEMRNEAKDPDEFARSSPERYRHAIEQAESIYDFLIKSAFSKYDEGTTEGKEQVSRELSPVLASIDDEIVRAHCIKIVAQKLGVSEEAVGKQVSKQSSSQQHASDEEPQKKEKTRQEILEERLLGLILQSSRTEEYEGFFKTNKASRLMGELSRQGMQQIIPAEFVQKLPAELKDFFSEIFFAYGDIDSAEKDKEIEEIKKEIGMLQSKERMKELSSQIEQKEKEQDSASVKLLGEELDVLAKKLAQAQKEW